MNYLEEIENCFTQKEELLTINAKIADKIYDIYCHPLLEMANKLIDNDVYNINAALENLKYTNDYRVRLDNIDTKSCYDHILKHFIGEGDYSSKPNCIDYGVYTKILSTKHNIPYIEFRSSLNGNAHVLSFSTNDSADVIKNHIINFLDNYKHRNLELLKIPKEIEDKEEQLNNLIETLVDDLKKSILWQLNKFFTKVKTQIIKGVIVKIDNQKTSTNESNSRQSNGDIFD